MQWLRTEELWHDQALVTSPVYTSFDDSHPTEWESEMARSVGSKGSNKGTSGRKANPALMKPMQPSKELAAVVGSKPLSRPDAVSKIWDYIKKHNLQNPENKREIVADGKLKAVFGKDRVTMFEMNKHLFQHLK
jgi:chromatin remodeling complex protein RSC6